jgi:hypothetical protein
MENENKEELKEKKEKVKLVYRENNIDSTLAPIDLTKEYENLEITMLITEQPDFLARHDKKDKEKNE